MTDNIRFPSQITTGKVIPEGSGKRAVRDTSQGEFEKLLDREINKAGDLKFSAHVIKRMGDRSIEFTENEIAKISRAVDKAEGKGIRESLVVMNDVSLIISIKNKTVITAVDNKSMKENVITNIDGAVFI